MVALRLHVFVKVWSRARKAFELEWYHRRERLVNRRRSVRRTDKVHQMSGGLCLLALSWPPRFVYRAALASANV